VRQGFTPPQFAKAYAQVDRVEEILPALARLAAQAGERAPMPLILT